MPSQPTSQPTFVRPLKETATVWLKATFAKTETMLQYQGSAYTIVLLHVLLNFLMFAYGAGPAWRKGTRLHFPLRAAGALARGGGAMLNYNAAMVIFVASRNLMTLLRQTYLNMLIPFDKAVPAFHTLVGNSLVFATSLHVLGHIVRYSILRLRGPGFFGPVSMAISGSLLTTIIVAMRITALLKLRQRSFETFYWVHMLGAAAFFTLLVMHGSHVGVLKSYMYVSAPVIIYIIDRVTRMFSEHTTILSLPKRSVTLKGKDMVFVCIPRLFSYRAGQYAELNAPVLSRQQWHPFTIASSPHESEMHFFIKANGNWTRRLHDLFSDGNQAEVTLHVRGPYGAPAQHIGQYEHVVLVSGGVGATPFASITKYIHHWITNYAAHGAAAANTVAAAFVRNQSPASSPTTVNVRDTESDEIVVFQRSPNRRRVVSPVQARNILQHPLQRGSLPFARSIPGHSASPARNNRQFIRHTIPRSDSGPTGQVNVGGSPTRESSQKTEGSVGIVIQNPRRIQLNSPTNRIAAHTANNKGQTSHEKFMRPHDYDEELGNPMLPIPDRPEQGHGSPHSPSQRNSRTMEFDSSQKPVTSGIPTMARRMSFPARRIRVSNQEANNPESAELEVQEELFRSQNNAENAYDMIGTSSNPIAMMRRMHSLDRANNRSSWERASLDLGADAGDTTTWQERALFYLRSVSLNWAFLWTMLVRFFLVLAGRPFGIFSFDHRGLGIFMNTGWNVVDLWLSVFMAIPIFAAMGLEMSIEGIQSFVSRNLAKSVELFAIAPLLTLCMLLQVLGFSGVATDTVHASKVTVLLIWPLLTSCLVYRTARIMRSQITIAPLAKSSHAQTKSVDYIWVGRSPEEDTWLLENLLPLAGTGIVRLHRYITRGKPAIEPWMLDFETVPIKTTYARPDWDDVFGSLVERSRSGSTIGVFFCGPDGMASMVQQAAMRAMSKSMDNAYRRGYFAKKTDGDKNPLVEASAIETRVCIPGSTSSGCLRGLRSRNMKRGTDQDANIANSSEYGCNVRIMVRIENFS